VSLECNQTQHIQKLKNVLAVLTKTQFMGKSLQQLQLELLLNRHKSYSFLTDLFSILVRFIVTQSRLDKSTAFLHMNQDNVNNIPAAHVSAFYSSATIFFYPLILFFCLWHSNMPIGRRSPSKVFPYTLRYFITINLYFDEQLH
jgi:hypothetical protein